jgi:hypothetical protein
MKKGMFCHEPRWHITPFLANQEVRAPRCIKVSLQP